MHFAWACRVLGQSIGCVVPRVVTVSGYPLKAERDSFRLNLYGSLQNGVNDPLSRFVARVANCL